MMMITDYFWGVYIKSVANHQAIRASLFGALIMLCGAFTAISYISDHWALIPAVIGGMIGTYISVKYNKDNNGTSI
jgi:predicted branched-subunit amino acid permease